MFFMSHCFAAGEYSLDTTPPPEYTVTSVTISSGAFDEVNMTRNTNTPYTPGYIDPLWYFGTVLHALFQENTHAGNVNFSVDNTDSVRVKRRMKDSFSWISLFDVPVYDTDSLNFDRFDVTVRGNSEYEYALCPVSGGIEGDFITNSVKTCFNGLFIVERNQYYSTCIINEFDAQQQNKPVSTVVPLGRRYPFTVINGDANYKTGNISATFMNQIGMDYDVENSWKLREELNGFLFNGQPKLIKYEDGRMYLAAVSSAQISESGIAGNYSPVQTSFGWTEKGDGDDGRDLYRYGFIDARNEAKR